MILLLLGLFIVVPLVELYVIIQVGREIGALWTILLLVVDSVLGSMLLRAQGRAAWRRFNEALATRRVPTTEVLDGALIIIGGTLLLTPGFITDVVGLLLLVPPTRAVARRLMVRRMTVRAAVATRLKPPGRRPDSGPRQPYDVDGNATEL